MKPLLTTATLGAVLTVVLAGCGSSSHHTATKKVAAKQPAPVVKTVTVAPPLNSSTGATAGAGSTTSASGTSTGPGAVPLPTSTTGAFGSTGDFGLTAQQAGLNVANLPRPFAADSPWNTQVANARPANDSAFLMKQAETRYGVVTLTNQTNDQANNLDTLKTNTVRIKKPLFINTTIWTDPIIPSAGGENVTLVCRQVNLPPPRNDCGDGYDLPSLPIEQSVFPKPQYDGWLTVYDQATGYAYDFWRARFDAADATLTYQFVRRWQIDGPGFLPPNAVSARGSGLPMFAGEIMPRDIIGGTIRHALAISLPGPASRFYVQPASSTDGNGAFQSLPEGARIRLNPNFNVKNAVKRLPGGTNIHAAFAIYRALKTYGAIVVDRSAVPTLYALPNFNWAEPLRNKKGLLLSPDGKTLLPPTFQNVRYETPLLSGNVVQGIHLDDFQVVQLPTKLQYPPVGSEIEVGGINGVAPQPVVGLITSSGSQVAPGVQAQGTPNVGESLP